MKLPSMIQVLHDARSTFLRFPIVICDAILGTTAALLLVDFEGPSQPTVLFPILFASILGIPLFIALQLIAVKRRWTTSLSVVIHCIGLLLLVAYGFITPQDYPNAPGFYLFQFFMLAAAFNLFVSVAPFYGRGELNAFWYYNKTLFIRALAAILYTGVLWIGLSIALLALDHLFGVDIPGKRYPELWILLNGIFCTWFFVAGLPQDLPSLESSTEYPKGLKIFTQYIILPIVLVYLAILYAYLFKVVFSWDWPQGWVSKLILGFAGTGIFALLLVHPLSDRTGQVWIKTVSRWFYVILSPLIVMLFFAVWRRTSEYGLTEGRCLAIVLGAWLVGMAAYFTLSKIKNIKVIPATLFVLLLVFSFGPWSIFAFSEQSQVDRLKEYLLRDSILVDGKIHASHQPVSYEDSKQISSIVAHLREVHGYGAIQPWFGESLKQDSLGTRLAVLGADVVTGKLGITYTNAWQYGSRREGFLSADMSEAVDLREFQWLLPGIHVSPEMLAGTYPSIGFSYRVGKQLDTMTFMLTRGNLTYDTLQVDLHALVSKVMNDSARVDLMKIPADRMSATRVGRHWKMRIIVRQAFVERHATEEKAAWYNLDLLCSSNETDGR